ncbi:unnamed protein product, partial [Meganyctiphanes norvegica]
MTGKIIFILLIGSCMGVSQRTYDHIIPGRPVAGSTHPDITTLGAAVHRPYRPYRPGDPPQHPHIGVTPPPPFHALAEDKSSALPPKHTLTKPRRPVQHLPATLPVTLLEEKSAALPPKHTLTKPLRPVQPLPATLPATLLEEKSAA